MATSPPKPRRSDPAAEDALESASENASEDDLPEEVDGDDAELPEELEDETGIDLTDASDLDADNVPADEESDRVGHAPD